MSHTLFSPHLSKKKALIIEDEPFVIMLLEDILNDLGLTTLTPCTTIDDAQRTISSETFDVAVLDINLNGIPSYSLAEICLRRNIALIFSTGYGHTAIPQHFQHVTLLYKPYTIEQVYEALLSVMPQKSP